MNLPFEKICENSSNTRRHLYPVIRTRFMFMV